MWKINIGKWRKYLPSRCKKQLMIQFDKKPATPHYSKEASELNKLAIKLKKEVLKGNITTVSVEEIDEATIPALHILRSQKYRN